MVRLDARPRFLKRSLWSDLGAVEVVGGGQQLERAAHADLPGDAEALHAVGELGDVEVGGGQADPAAEAGDHARERDRVAGHPVGEERPPVPDRDDRARELVPELPAGAAVDPAGLAVDHLAVHGVELDDPAVVWTEAVLVMPTDDAPT